MVWFFLTKRRMSWVYGAGGKTVGERRARAGQQDGVVEMHLGCAYAGSVAGSSSSVRSQGAGVSPKMSKPPHTVHAI